MKIKIVEHSGEQHLTSVVDFNAKETHLEIKNAQSNVSSDHMVCIGDVIIDARSVKSVVPVVEE
ncbi:hypothetical protein ACWE42_24445 [Sutcliffiella cohnii]